MTIGSWKNEFYPTRAFEATPENAVAHSLQKWRGLLPENMAKHGVAWTPGKWTITDDEDAIDYFNISASTCSLCAVYDDEAQSCEACPLCKVRGGVPCDSLRKDESPDSVPWEARAERPEVMIDWLEKAAAFERGEMQPIADCAPVRLGAPPAEGGGILMELDEFTKGYIVCALWSTTDHSTESGGDPLDQNYDEDDIATESLAEIIETCKDFQQANAELLNQYVEKGRSMDHAGHDFWLSRCGHGTGFWDRGFGEVGDKLDNAAEVYSGCDITVGDDGKLYFS